jgi:phosphate/sulfate permease
VEFRRTGIATLVGSGVTSYRRAVLWGTVWTALGGLLAAFAT